eukprot:15283438-Alexandrium_andersonii.AAC.1
MSIATAGARPPERAGAGSTSRTRTSPILQKSIWRIVLRSAARLPARAKRAPLPARANVLAAR